MHTKGIWGRCLVHTEGIWGKCLVHTKGVVGFLVLLQVHYVNTVVFHARYFMILEQFNLSSSLPGRVLV